MGNAEIDVRFDPSREEQDLVIKKLVELGRVFKSG
jgi:hypothetical protein